MARIAHVDIETTNLNANIGYIVSAAIREHGAPDGEVILLSIRDCLSFKKDPTDDRELVRELVTLLQTYDLMTTWYGERFDLPFINTRAMLHGYEPVTGVKHLDLWKTCRKKLKLHSNRLQTFQQTFELEEAKTPLNFRCLQRAYSGHIPSIQNIEEHNIQDVLVLELAYTKLLPLISGHPSLAVLDEGKLLDSCPKCGSDKLQKKGYYYTPSNKFRKYYCPSCKSTCRQRLLTKENEMVPVAS